MTGLTVFAVLPFERAGAALAGRAPAAAGWILAGLLLLVVPAWVVVRVERQEAGQGGFAIVQLSAVALLMVFATALVTIQLFPDAIPEIVPASVVWQGDGPAKAIEYAREQSAVEAGDPYVLPLIISALLFAVLGLLSTIGTRRMRPLP
jgi:hypothetical protein